MNTITSTDIQNNFVKIAISFRDTVSNYSDFYDNNLELILLLNKINTNMQAAMNLLPIRFINEAKIIMRSAFETTVLFEYLVEFPEQITNYKEDAKITDFKNIFIHYKKKLFNKNDIIDSYNKYYNDIISLKKFKTDNNYDFVWLEKYFSSKDRNSFKPMSQQIFNLINKLTTNNSLHKEELNNFKWDFYDYNSQITHTNFKTLIMAVSTITNKQVLEETQEQFKSCICIYKIIFETLMDKFNFDYPNNFYSEINSMCKLLGIKL